MPEDGWLAEPSSGVRGDDNPVTPLGVALQGRVSASEWDRRVQDARTRLSVVTEVEAAHQRTGRSYHQSLAEVAPEVSWSCYRHWLRRLRDRTGPDWERLIERRVAPEPVRVPKEVRLAAVMVRRTKPSVRCEETRERLVEEFGEAGRISDATLRRIWRVAGLTRVNRLSTGRPTAPGLHQGQPPRASQKVAPVKSENVSSQTAIEEAPESVEHHSGGGVLALLGAALGETQGHVILGRAVLSAARESAAADPGSSVEPPSARDDLGRFTVEFNKQVRAGMQAGDRDPRLDPDAEKRRRRAITSFRILEHSPAIIGYKLLAMGATPLLVDSRGFDGLAGPQGDYLGILGGTAYMPATLDKALAEMAELEVAGPLLSAYTTWSIGLMRGWSRGEGTWQQKIIFVDATQDPYWTKQYAQSGKVSRLNQVMPNLSRVSISAGAGPPVLVETVAGAVSLKTNLVPTLKRLESITGEDTWRLLCMDNEMCTPKILSELMRMKPHRIFVTVLKGQLAENAPIEITGKMQSYRERDRLEEGTVQLSVRETGEVLDLRVVVMSRCDSRQPTDTIFVTNATTDELDTPAIADTYLSRWPNQEQTFRDMRNGGGLNRSHGYGGENVVNVALDTKIEKCERTVVLANARLQKADDLCEQLQAEKAKQESRSPLSEKTLKMAEKARAQCKKQLNVALDALDRLQSMPRLIFKRDVKRDTIATVANLLVLMLCEFVMREYFQGTRLTYRTLIEYFVHMPTTVLTYRDRIVYRITANPRAPDHMEAFRLAAAEVNRRELRKGNRLIVIEVVDPPGRKV